MRLHWLFCGWNRHSRPPVRISSSMNGSASMGEKTRQKHVTSPSLLRAKRENPDPGRHYIHLNQLRLFRKMTLRPVKTPLRDLTFTQETYLCRRCHTKRRRSVFFFLCLAFICYWNVTDGKKSDALFSTSCLCKPTHKVLIWTPFVQ